MRAPVALDLRAFAKALAWVTVIPAAGLPGHRCAQCFYNSLWVLAAAPKEMGIAILVLPIPERKKRRLGKVKSLAPGHKAGIGIWGCLTPKPKPHFPPP